MAKVLIINGAPRSGKDTFIDCMQEITDTVRYSSIDWVKEKAKLLGWDGKKNAKGRRFLSDIKNATTEYNNTPFKEIIKQFDCYPSAQFKFICVNIREPSEIKKLVSYCKNKNIECFTIRIVNDEAEKKAKAFSNTGDNGYMNYNYNYKLENNYTLNSFKRSVFDFYSTYLK